MPRLVIRGQDGRPDRVFEAEARVCTIGRSAENTLQIDDLNSSRHHCELHEVPGGGFELIDKDSRNGTFLNGRRVTRKQLVPGDKIEIGTTVIYFDRLPDEITKVRQGKETLDLSTGLFAPVGDPSGAKQRAFALSGETGRISAGEVRNAELVSVEERRGVMGWTFELAPNASRLSIRFWFDNEFGVLAESYRRFVADMRIEPPPRILITGSLYLAGEVLAHNGTPPT